MAPVLLTDFSSGEWIMMFGSEWMGGGGMWLGGIWMVLVGLLVVLSIAALVKYLMK